MDSNTLRRVPDKHGNLQRNPAALDEVEGILTARPIIVKAAKPIALRVDAPGIRPHRRSHHRAVTPAEHYPARRPRHVIAAKPEPSPRHASSAQPPEP